MEKALSYLANNGGTERDLLLAEADYCRMCAEREVALGDDLKLANELFTEADRLTAAANIH